MGEGNNRLATPTGNNGPIDSDSPKPASYSTPWPDVKPVKTPLPQPVDPSTNPRTSQTLYWNPKTAEVVLPITDNERTSTPTGNSIRSTRDTRILDRKNAETIGDLDVIVSTPDHVSDFAEEGTLNTMRAMGSLSSMIETDLKEAFDSLQDMMQPGQNDYIFSYDSAGQRFMASYSVHDGIETIAIGTTAESYRPVIAIAKTTESADFKDSNIKSIRNLDGHVGLFVYLENDHSEDWKTPEEVASDLKIDNGSAIRKSQLYALAFLRDEVERHISERREIDERFIRDE